MPFTWKDRAAIVRRVAVMVLCLEGYTLDRAIDEALRKQDGAEYRYCNAPDGFTERHRKQLRKDVMDFLSVPERLLVAGRMRNDSAIA